MKHLILLASLAGLLLQANAQTVYSTNTLAGSATFILTTNRVAAYSFEITATNATTVYFYDQDSLAAPYYGTNWVTGSYISRSTFPTNIASSYVNPQGYTNWYTNAGLYTLTVTNAAATNSLPAMATISVGANETRVSYIDAVFTRGVAVRPTGGASITIYAR